MLVEAIMNMMTELESFIYGKYDLAHHMAKFASSDEVTYLTIEPDDRQLYKIQRSNWINSLIGEKYLETMNRESVLVNVFVSRSHYDLQKYFVFQERKYCVTPLYLPGFSKLGTIIYQMEEAEFNKRVSDYNNEELGYEEWDMEHEMFKSWIPSVCFVMIPQTEGSK